MTEEQLPPEEPTEVDPDDAGEDDPAEPNEAPEKED